MKKSIILALFLILLVGSASTFAYFYYFNPLSSSKSSGDGDDNDDNGATSLGHVNIYVNYSILSSISSSVAQYESDIQTQGYTTSLIGWTSLSVIALKAQITNDYNSKGLKGAVLIGEMPYAIARGRDPYNNFYDYPCDLYLMDLDGSWTDLNGNGVYDLDWQQNPFPFEHSNGTGDDTPEIWIARIGNYTKNPGYNYANELNSYFSRNFDLRHIQTLTYRPHKALLYIDDDWTSLTSEYVSNFTAYTGSELDVYNDTAPLLTNSIQFMSNLTNPLFNPSFVYYELVHLMVHSWPYQHQFGPSGSGSQGFLTWNDVQTNNTEPLFYNLFACYACNYTSWNNLGTQYLLTGDTITVVGCARSGGMSCYQPFYDSLKAGKIFGEAFKDWFHNTELKQVFATPPSHWHEVYGMVMLGDPLATIYMSN
ncbi:MAG: hypothetical protein ACFFAN_00855 [Promethearchaeota archaeon]